MQEETIAFKGQRKDASLFSTFFRRALSTVIFLFLFLIILFSRSLGPHIGLLLVACAVGVGLHELYDLLERKGFAAWRVCGITSGLMLVIAGYTYALGMRAIPLGTASILFLFFSTFSVQLYRGTRNSLATVMATFFGVLYVAAPLAAAFWIYDLPKGRWLLLFLFLVTCLNDIGAYLIGSRFGRTQLCPSISPNKTIEGSLGGMFCGIVGAFLVGWITQFLPPANDFFWEQASVSLYLKAFFLAVLLSVFGQIGDLSESMIKRDAGVKDSGGSFTGHGGVLDMVDSLLFTIPFTFLYARTVLGME